VPNRAKTERNAKILRLWNTGKWRQIAIARMFKMKPSTVGMVISRARHRKDE